jgi:hypothetical protein
MFSRNDGSLYNATTKGASSTVSRRKERRAVSSSGRIAKARALEGGRPSPNFTQPMSWLSQE